jgi:metal-dependent amidase/aminoacylase/carboxypeptidase family protein
VDIVRTLPRFAEIRYDRVLSKLFASSCERFTGLDTGFLEVDGEATYTPPSGRAASTDVGNLSWAVPTIQPMLRLETHGHGNHEAAFTAASIGPTARPLLVDGAKALAKTLLAAAVDHRDYFLEMGSGAARATRRQVAGDAEVFDLGVPLIEPPINPRTDRTA